MIQPLTEETDGYFADIVSQILCRSKQETDGHPGKICYAFRKYAHSVWRDWITEHGEGIHHIAFGVEGADEVAQKLVNQFGAVIEQRGFYGDGSGQYIYLDCFKELKCRIELLESFRKG